MRWDDLRYVLETVRQGGLSGAARVLRVNHATVSRRIAAFEADAGVRLFDRLPTGYAPTSEGHSVAKSAALMEDAQLDLRRTLAAGDHSLSGPLVITASQLLVERALSPILSDFRSAHPEIELKLVASNETLNLARHEADVAIRIGDTPTPTLVGMRVSGQKAAAFANLDMVARLQANPDGVLDWVRFAHWPGLPDTITNAWPHKRVTLVVDDMTAAIGAVRAGIGATRMPCFLGDTDPMLARVPGVPVFDYPPIWVLTHPDFRSTPKVAAFMDFAARRLRKLRPAFEGRSLID